MPLFQRYQRDDKHFKCLTFPSLLQMLAHCRLKTEQITSIIKMGLLNAVSVALVNLIEVCIHFRPFRVFIAMLCLQTVSLFSLPHWRN